MRRTLLITGLVLVAAAALAPAVRGGDEPQGGPDGVWVYDVRVVRVDTPTPEAVEAALPWEAAGTSTVDTPWPVLLQQLKARGATTILLDQRVTGCPGYTVTASQTRDRQIETLVNRDLANERWQGSPCVTGCTAKLETSTRNVLEYNVEARWEIRSEVERVRPIFCSSRWDGTHPDLTGRTLVLSYREQAETWGDARVGVEIHAFVTARLQR